jgi:hypothetical protein
MGLQFDVVYQPNVPTAVQTVVNAVCAFYESIFTNNVTVNLDVGWGQLGNTGEAVESGAIGENIESLSGPYTYAQIKSALAADGKTVDDALADGSLTASNPAPSTTYLTTTAEAKALGLMGASNAIDGQVGFDSTASFTFNTSNGESATPGTYDLFSVAAHEITEVMGRVMLEGNNLGVSGAQFYDPMDLFQYSAAGTRLFTQAAQPNYFSLDNGVTDLVNLNSVIGGDAGDWAGNTADSFNAFGSTSGAPEPVSAMDIAVMGALGWDTPLTSTNASFLGSGNFAGATTGAALWQASDGEVLEFLMTGTTATWSVVTLNGTPETLLNTGWSVSGTGDFNGDGKTDVLLQNTNGEVGMWLMNGTQIATPALITLNGNNENLQNTGWSIVGTGDFNGDGNADVLLQNTNGEVGMWEMNGTQIATAALVTLNGTTESLLNTGWSVLGIGNFNNNGTSDVLLQNTNGAIGEWLMNGTQIATAALVTLNGNPVSVAGSGWSYLGAGDVNGKTEALWQNTNGQVGEWLMNGTKVTMATGVS